MKKSSWCGLSLASVLWAGSAACGDDHDDDGDHAHAAALSDDCQEIVDACHDHDEGAGEIHECHELAHDNDTKACTEKKASCLEACGHAH